MTVQPYPAFEYDSGHPLVAPPTYVGKVNMEGMKSVEAFLECPCLVVHASKDNTATATTSLGDLQGSEATVYGEYHFQPRTLSSHRPDREKKSAVSRGIASTQGGVRGSRGSSQAVVETSIRGL